MRLNEAWLADPLKWTRPRRIFVCAHGDLFHEAVPDAWIAEIMGVMVAAVHLRGHVLQVLTKRGERAAQLLSNEEFWAEANAYASAEVMDRVDPLGRRTDDARATLDDYGPDEPPPGIWIGVSVEDQTRADERCQDLASLARHGWTTFVSYEPALGPVDWSGWEFLAWLICGGENGPRPMHPDWARAARGFCASAGIPFFFKQWGSWIPADFASGTLVFLRADGSRGGWREEGAQEMWKAGKKNAGRRLDGIEHNGMPA